MNYGDELLEATTGDANLEVASVLTEQHALEAFLRQHNTAPHRTTLAVLPL